MKKPELNNSGKHKGLKSVNCPKIKTGRNSQCGKENPQSFSDDLSLWRMA